MSGNNTERNLANLEAGQEQQIHLLVQSVEKATSRNGSVYEKLKIRDTEGHDAVLINWNEPFSQPLPATITARVQTELYRETNSYKMLSYQKDNSIPTDDFLPKPKIDVKQYWRELNAFAKTLPTGLHALVGNVLMADQKRFVYLPLTASKSFARRCGILEATLKLTQMAAASAPIMNLDRNITVTAAILYYVGYTRCIDDAFMGTADDILVGAGVSGYTMVLEKARELMASGDKAIVKSLNEQDVKCVLHILLSRYRGISAAIPEATLLRHLDAVVMDTDLMAKSATDIMPGKAGYVNGVGYVYNRGQ